MDENKERHVGEEIKQVESVEMAQGVARLNLVLPADTTGAQLHPQLRHRDVTRFWINVQFP